jgi:hypothetical protein
MVAMATAKSGPLAEISEIQRRMAMVRHEMDHDVREAVKGAQSLTDWRSLVRGHPWLALTTAAATGYLIVPKRRTATPAVVAVGIPAAGPAPVMSTPMNLASPPPKKATWGLIGSVLSLLAPVAIRAAQNYAAQYLEQRLVPQSDGGDRFGASDSEFPGPRGPRDVR